MYRILDAATRVNSNKWLELHAVLTDVSGGVLRLRVVILNLYCNSVNNVFLKDLYDVTAVILENRVATFVTANTLRDKWLRPSGYFMYPAVKVQIVWREWEQD